MRVCGARSPANEHSDRFLYGLSRNGVHIQYRISVTVKCRMNIQRSACRQGSIVDVRPFISVCVSV